MEQRPASDEVEAAAGGEFDHYARLVRRLLHVPVGLVTVVEDDRQVFTGMAGLPSPWAKARETPLSHSFCRYVVKDERPLVVTNARLDAHLADNPAVRDLDVVAYAGWPLTDHTGRTVGSLCAIDTEPRTWSSDDLDTLRDLAAACSAELAQRDRAELTEQALAVSRALGERSRVLLSLSTLFSRTETLADVASAVIRVTGDELGCLRSGVWLRDSAQTVGLAPSGLPVLSTGTGPELLTVVAESTVRWPAAAAYAELPIDDSNPIGAALIGPEMILFGSRDEQNARFPTVANPGQSGQARAFVPLMLRGRFYGTMVLIWPDLRAFSSDDRDTLAALGAYTAQAVHRAQLLEERDEVSRVLQRAMLTRLPDAEHLELAARYRPAHASEAVGGDWYDAVVAPDGSTHVMIGDVIGHDIAAAAMMGQLRSMLRMTAWQSSGPPSSSLQQLDRAIRGLQLDTFATAVLARIDPAPGRACQLSWSNAGHPPPLLLSPDGTARLLLARHGSSPLLGAATGDERFDETVSVPAGSTLLLYTDGLVERRREHLDAGLERLRSCASRLAGLPPDAFLDALLDQLADPTCDDDIALLAVRVGPA